MSQLFEFLPKNDFNQKLAQQRLCEAFGGLSNLAVKSKLKLFINFDFCSKYGHLTHCDNCSYSRLSFNNFLIGKKRRCEQFWGPPIVFYSSGGKNSVVCEHIVWKLLKMSHLKFWHFPTIIVVLKLTCLVTLFDSKLQVFKNSPKWTIFGVFNQLLSTQNVNVARFARNVEWDFFFLKMRNIKDIQSVKSIYCNES